MSFNKHIVVQSDFGVADGAVAAMLGVMIGVDDSLHIHHLTHDIPPYDIYLASYRLFQTYAYWPKGTVFVSIVDPGVGFDQKSIVVKLKSGHYVVTPDNGTITHLAKFAGIEEVYEIDKARNLLASTNQSYTFYGRDLYAYTASRLSSNNLTLEELGQKLQVSEINTFEVEDPYEKDRVIYGHIAIHDERYGSLWSNIPFEVLNSKVNQGEKVKVRITHNAQVMYDDEVVMAKSFQDVSKNQAVVYCNSLQNVAIALNQNSFANAYHIGYDQTWKLEITY